MLLALAEHLEPVVVEAGGRVGRAGAQLLAVGVGLEHGELRLCAPERELLALELDAGREDGVLELVLALGELCGDQAGFTGLAQAVEPLAVLAARRIGVGLAERLELLPREQVAVARDDLGALGDLLLADPHGAAFLRALEQVALQAGLVIGRAEDFRDAHRPRNLPHSPYLFTARVRLSFESRKQNAAALLG